MQEIKNGIDRTHLKKYPISKIHTKIAFFLNFKEGNFSKKTCIKEKIDVFLLYKDCTISENVLRKIFRRCGKYDTTPNH